MAETLADLIAQVTGGYRSPAANSIARTRQPLPAVKQFEMAQATAGPAGNAQDQGAGAYAPQPRGRYIGSDIAEASGLPALRRGIQHVANAAQMPTLDQPDELGAALPELAQGGLGALGLMAGGEGPRAPELPMRRMPMADATVSDQPMLYHGNAAHLGEVRPRLFTTNDTETASFFAKLDRNRTRGARRLNPIQPNFTNPMTIDGQGYMITHATMRRGKLPQILDQAEAAGHDAVVFHNVLDGPGAATRDQMPIDVTVVLNPQSVRVGRPEYLDNPSIVDRVRDVFTSRTATPPRTSASPEPVTPLPANPTRALGRTAEGGVLPVANGQPFRQSFVGGTGDLNEAAAMRSQPAGPARGGAAVERSATPFYDAFHNRTSMSLGIPELPSGARRAEAFSDARLSPMQNKVVEMRRNGFNDPEIADELESTPASVAVAASQAKVRAPDVHIPSSRAQRGPENIVAATVERLMAKGITSRQAILARTNAILAESGRRPTTEAVIGVRMSRVRMASGAERLRPSVTPDEVAQMWALRDQGLSHEAIGARLNRTQVTVSNWLRKPRPTQSPPTQGGSALPPLGAGGLALLSQRPGRRQTDRPPARIPYRKPTQPPSGGFFMQEQ